jgi:HD superfamily phosphohydrolase
LKVVRDALWGDLELEPEELALVDTPEFQRLRGVRQLGTAHLVYPCANHTRFEHSLGTAHVAKRILAELERSGTRLDPRDRRATVLAALLHDVTHVPFGHTFEDERRIFERHDVPERTRAFLTRGELGAALERTGLREDVLARLGAAPAAELPPLAQVVSGTIGADLLDYLARDAYFTGIRHGYDDRLFRYFSLVQGRVVLRLHKAGRLREDALSEVVHLLRLRYTLSERVYYHHAKVASGALVSKLVERATALGFGFDELRDLTDEGLLSRLEMSYAPRDPVLARLLLRLRARRLPKRAFVLTRRIPRELQDELVRRFHLDRAERERTEAELEVEAGLEPGDALIYCPSPAMALKEAHVPVEVDAGPLRSLADLDLPEVGDLLEKHRDLWKFFVFIDAERRGRAGALSAACARRFGEPDELAGLVSGELRFHRDRKP